MEPRMTNAAAVLPEAMRPLMALGAAIKGAGLPVTTIDLVNMRASQINGCSVCLHMHSRDLRKAGESDERLDTLAGWRDAPWFTDAERAALELTETLTRVADRPNAVSDEIYAAAAEHYDERELATLIFSIGLINLFNRLNLATRQVAGAGY
jgi:AhpD family alkylhydroperoxidase